MRSIRCLWRKVVFPALLLALALSACAAPSAEQQEQEAQAIYQAFLETCKTDQAAALEQYCHYEYDWIREIAMESLDPLTSYEIQSWERINDCLWAASIYAESRGWPEGFIAMQFVGIIDGEYKVMTGVNQVPESLGENLDREQYRPTGENIVDPEDVIH